MTHRQQAEHWLLQADAARRGNGPGYDNPAVVGCERRAGVHAILAVVELLGDANEAVERAISIPEAEVVEDEPAQ